MRVNKQLLLLFVLSLLFSCHRQQEQKLQNAFGTKVIEAHGYVVPTDSMAPPQVIAVNENKLKKVPAGKPKVTPVNSKVHRVGNPVVIIAGAPVVCTIGKDSFLLPKTVPAVGVSFVAGAPQVVTAGHSDSRGSFETFGEPQGLKHIAIYGLLADREGNIWIGGEGGVTKYDGKSFTTFGETEGLNGDEVMSIFEDKDGNIWFGTATKGVSKYDGKTFTQYTTKDGLTGNWVIQTFADKAGNLWFCTDAGVTKYDGKTFTGYTQKQGLANNSVYSVTQDNDGNMWFGTLEGVSKFDSKCFTNFSVKEGLINNRVYACFNDKSGTLWFGAQQGLSKYDGKSFFNYTVKQGLTDNAMWRILQDRNDNLWFGTWYNGASEYDGKTFTNFSKEEGLNSNITSMVEDKNGNIWFGAENGLSRYVGKTFTHITVNEGMSNSSIYAIHEGKDSGLWLGTSGSGLFHYHGKSLSQLTYKEGLGEDEINVIAEDKTGALLLGENNLGVSKYDGKSFTYFATYKGLTGYNIYSIFNDNNGNLWFGSENGVTRYDGKTFTNYSGKQGLKNNTIHCMLNDSAGGIWFGTTDYGAYKYDGKKFTEFTTNEGLAGNIVRKIIKDKSGNLWFGTNGGISKYDGKAFTNFTEHEGLAGNVVYDLLQDKAGNLWVATNFGLSKLSADKLAALNNGTIAAQGHHVLFRNYTAEDGLIGSGCYSIAEGADGTIWIGVDNQLNAYNAVYDIPDTAPPNIQLANIELYNENMNWQKLLAPATGKQNAQAKDTGIVLGNGVKVRNFEFDGVSGWYGLPQHLSLAYNNNYLTFNFVGITTKSPKKVRYKYMLEGLDDNWSALTGRNDATYGNVPPGNYIFTVKAMNGEGYWSNEYHYSFAIRPPWWQTWWFRGLAILCLTGAVAFYIKWRERSLKQRQNELENTVEERTAEVVAEKKEVEKQKDRSENLLLNILPTEVAEELKEKGTAGAKLFDDVTVLFTDFVGFTKASERLTPQQLVDELHACFSAFDGIMAKYNIEKIKTVGDAYLAISGLPLSNKNHAADVVKAAIEIRDFMLHRKLETGNRKLETFEIRIGIHSGSVVAGIVGIKKFAYDIWGDTVNTAARMEQNSEAGKINISQTTYELVKDKFKCEYRGEIEAKNKGLLKMYFVEGSLI